MGGWELGKISARQIAKENKKKKVQKKRWVCPVTDSNRCLPAARMQTGIYLARNVPSYTNGPHHGGKARQGVFYTPEDDQSWDGMTWSECGSASWRKEGAANAAGAARGAGRFPWEVRTTALATKDGHCTTRQRPAINVPDTDRVADEVQPLRLNFGKFCSRLSCACHLLRDGRDKVTCT